MQDVGLLTFLRFRSTPGEFCDDCMRAMFCEVSCASLLLCITRTLLQLLSFIGVCLRCRRDSRTPCAKNADGEKSSCEEIRFSSFSFPTLLRLSFPIVLVECQLTWTTSLQSRDLENDLEFPLLLLKTRILLPLPFPQPNRPQIPLEQ